MEVEVEMDYEQARNARVEENRRRMEEMGLFLLHKELKDPNKKNRKPWTHRIYKKGGMVERLRPRSSTKNMGSCDTKQEPNGEIIEGASTCDMERQHVEDIVATTLENISVKDPRDDTNSGKPWTHKVHKKGVVAERLRALARSLKNTGC